jgi:putative sigma-54 modulation protein
MYAAIDGLIDKLDRQVIKYKEKRKSHRGNGQKGAALEEPPSVEPSPADAESSQMT